MKPDSLEKNYKIIRIIIFAIPAFVILLGMYLVLFPIESFNYFGGQPDISKFEIEKKESSNEISFGIFPTLNHQNVSLKIDLGNTKNNCPENPPEIALEKTYRAFLYPSGEPIKDKDSLKEYLFRENKSRYPNGSLLHLKPTDEVFLLSNGKKILFPGPEIFRAFGYSFDNLTDVEKSSLDQFPDADNRIFLWTYPHPDGTLFQAYPSHKIYLVADGKKHEIENVDDLGDLWPKYFTIPVDDTDPKNQLVCSPGTQETKSGKIVCLFDRQKLASSLGGYYNFTLKYPVACPVAGVSFKKASILLASEKSFSTVKDSFRKIFASIVNRYFLKQ
jgi:hypothetical protein